MKITNFETPFLNYPKKRGAYNSILSFFDDISLLEEGTYLWNNDTQQWELQKEGNK